MSRRPGLSARGRRRGGFTLIEVLCALVLIGVVLPVAMRGISISLNAAGRARHTGEATELARHKLAELSLSTDPTTYTGGGDCGPEWPEYRYESRYAERDYGVSELTVEVFWKSRGQDESLTLSTLVYPGAYLTGSAASGDATSGSTSAAGGTGAP